MNAPVLRASLARASAVAKKFDPNQKRDKDGKWSDGSGDSGGGVVGSAVGRYRKALHKARWDHRHPAGSPQGGEFAPGDGGGASSGKLTANIQGFDDVFGGGGGGGGSSSQSGRPYARHIREAEDEVRLARALVNGEPSNENRALLSGANNRLQQAQALQRRAESGQNPVLNPNIRISPQQRASEAERLAAINRARQITDASRDLAGDAPKGPQAFEGLRGTDIHDRAPPGVRAAVSSKAQEITGVARTFRSVLSAVEAFITGDKGEDASTLTRIAAIAGAVGTMAVAADIAARARNTNAWAEAGKSIKTASKILGRETPKLYDTIKNTDTRAQLRSALGAVSSRAQQFDSVLSASALGRDISRTASRTSFRATGGKIITPKPYVAPSVKPGSLSTSASARFVGQQSYKPSPPLGSYVRTRQPLTVFPSASTRVMSQGFPTTYRRPGPGVG